MVISIFKFMSRYYGIGLNAGVSCLHASVIQNFKFLNPCSFKYANSHQDLINEGKIIYVSDTSGRILAYICPTNKLSNECTYCKNIDDCDNNTDILNDIGSIPTYVLGELLSRYKRKPSIYKMIKRELIKRGVYDNKRYKIEEEINKLEESDVDDKYKRRRKIKCKKS